MKKILILGLATLVVAGFVWVAKNWADVQADYGLLRTDWAISRTKSWRMRLQPTDAKLPKDWTVVEAIPQTANTDGSMSIGHWRLGTQKRNESRVIWNISESEMIDIFAGTIVL
jgi:hypothetical protein